MNKARYLAGILLAAAVLGPAVLGVSPAHAIKGESVVLGGLDKVTGRISQFEVPVSKTVEFGNLRIIARSCDRTPPTEPPESAAFLNISEQKEGDAQPAIVFRGWMFASSPALSAMEHPVYDVWVVSCRIPKTEPKDKAEGN